MDAIKIQRYRWSWRAKAQGGAADTASTRSASCIISVQEELRGITSKRLRFIGWLQRRALMAHSAAWATCMIVAKALLKTTLKRCGGSSLLPPKDIL